MLLLPARRTFLPPELPSVEFTLRFRTISDRLVLLDRSQFTAYLVCSRHSALLPKQAGPNELSLYLGTSLRASF